MGAAAMNSSPRTPNLPTLDFAYRFWQESNPPNNNKTALPRIRRQLVKNLSTNPGQASSAQVGQPRQTLWINGLWLDVAMALSWIPFSLLAWAALDKPELLKLLMFSVFLFSFTHQPLSLFLVYGDKERFALRRGIFTWSPLLFGVVIFFGIHYSPLILAILAGAWNAEHTLMQRYGIARIYGRMAGQKEGGCELLMLFSWLLLAVVWAAADPNTMERVASLGIRGANRSAFEMVTHLRPAADFLLIPMFAVAGALAAKWVKEERARPVNPAKHFYLASTLALFAVMLVNPIMGFIGYVGAHAFEYFVIVNRSLEKNYIEPKRADSGLGWAANLPIGRLGLLVIYLGLIVLTVFVLENYASFLVYSMVFFNLGALHFFYDGFIWKLRNPAVARGVGAEIGA